MAPIEVVERFTQTAQRAAIHLRVTSALNPLLWLCAICTPCSFALAFFATGLLQTVMVVVGALPIFLACVAYVYWMLVAPDRLQTEDYQLRRQALQMIHEKGSDMAILATSVVAITNPEHPQLRDKE